MNFESGELIIKLKDEVDTKVYYAKSGKAKSNFNIGELLGVKDKIASYEVLFHQKSIEASIVNQQKMKAKYAAKKAQNSKNGYQPKEPLTLKNIFVVKTNDKQENILQLIEQIKDNPAVEYAEPNYIYSIEDFEVGGMITAEEASKMSTTNSILPIEVNDPLYSSQSNITATNIDDVWDQYTTGDGSQVIAILDTGGDYTHPDLEANTWINEAELNGVEGYDDDGNGYIDDIRGWDFINIDNAPLDDNMHGTHVAGIAGAVGNNGIGIAGAAWNVKLMHIKVFQSTGQGNATNIAAGVEYASENGADILNMSFGSYAESSTLKLALENAYATAVLVAAAGNNGVCIGPGLFCAPHYPAAYSFVIGVEDRPRPLKGYTNYDQDGPIFTRYSLNLLNYELAAPGTQIMSTIPNGGYATLTGTSMASPLIAGALALYNEQNPDDSKELMFGNLINTSINSGSSQPGFADMLAAIEIEPVPQMTVISAVNRDTINGQNGNGFWQPGETIEILPLVKNYWGPTDDVRVFIEFAEFEDTSKATIVQDEIEIGSISAYATLQNLEETLKITIANGVANNVDIKFNVTVWSGPNQQYISDPVKYVINVKNSVLLYGTYNEDLNLTNDQEYLVSDNLILYGDAVLTIEPGTIIKVSDDKRITFLENSKMICEGLNTSYIYWQAENVGWSGFGFGGDRSNIKYTHISGISAYNVNGQSFFGTSNAFDIEKSIITDNRAYYLVNSNGHSIKTSNIYENWIGTAAYYPSQRNQHRGVTKSNLISNYNSSGAIVTPNNSITFNSPSETNIFGNIYPNWTGNGEYHRNVFASGTGIINNWDIYAGSSDDEIIQTYVTDAYNSNATSNFIDKTTFSQIPHESPPGIVWKVVVNDKDAQDEYDLMDPIGVGSHEFKVYFSKEMDTSVDPQISYGVTMPYNQKIISEEGTWSSDGKIYTINHDIRVGAADGINRIRVQDAQDLDYFKIPLEDSRFNMLVQSAGSASAGWFATAGLGNIALEWTAPSTDELDDVLGYNMYRYQVDTDGVESDPEKLNETLIVEDTDESTTGIYFTDYEVVEGQTYFYKYKILRTSFEETDYSNAVSTAPLTSTLGDSNGDFEVNVLDLVQNVDYIVGNNPEPFIFVAGDVNADELINILDIVGTVDIIINGDTSSSSSSTSNEINFYPSNPVGDANFTWEGNDLYVESNFDIGGIQLAFNTDFDYILSEELPSIERLDYTQEDSKILMLYSFNNTVIASSKTKILTRLDASQEFDIEQAVVGTTSGAKLNAVLNSGVLSTIDAPFQNKNLQFLNLYPNPAEGLVHLEYYLPNQMDQVVAKVYDLLGRLVHIQVLENKEGISKTPMELSRLKTGNYIVLITANTGGSIKNIANKKLIIE
jgi:subtilisin family serine protease